MHVSQIFLGIGIYFCVGKLIEPGPWSINMDRSRSIMDSQPWLAEDLAGA
jgi:hypothetical protein